MDDPGRMDRTVEVENAADAALEVLAANGVEYFFNSPGTEFVPFWEHFARGSDPEHGLPTSTHGVSYVRCRHEELAMHMAMGYTLRTGAPQVVGLHVTVGTLHAAMSIHGAYHGRIPMVLLTSHADTHEGDRPGGAPGGHYLTFDAPGGFEDFVSGYVKWVAHPERPVSATRSLVRGFALARTPPSGPVLVNCAREVLYDEDLSRAPIARAATPTPPAPGPRSIERIVEALEAAENPLIVSGTSGLETDAREALVSLAERLGAPVIECPKWHHGVPIEHPLSLGDGTFGSHYLAKDVDLALVVDSARPWYPPEAGAPADATIVSVSPDPERARLAYWNYPVDLPVTGAAGPTLAALVEALPDRAPGGPVDWPAEHDALRSHWRGLAERGEGAVPIDPFWLCGELDRLLPDDAVVVQETTVHSGLVNNLLETRERAYLGAGKALAGGRGGGLGMALGAKLAEPERPVVAVLGDGAYAYNPVSAALGAAREHGLPIVAIVLDNGGYASQRRSHARTYPDGRAVRTGRFPGGPIRPRPDYRKEAAAYEAVGSLVEDPADVEAAVVRALEAAVGGRTAVVGVVLEERSPRERLEQPP